MQKKETREKDESDGQAEVARSNSVLEYQEISDPKGDDSDSTDEEDNFERMFEKNFDNFGIQDDDGVDRLRAKDSDIMKHSPFAVFGGVTIEQIRKDTLLKQTRKRKVSKFWLIFY